MPAELQILKTFADKLDAYKQDPDPGVDFSKIYHLKDQKRPTEDSISAYAEYLLPFIFTEIPEMPPLTSPMFVEHDLLGMPGEAGRCGLFQNDKATHDLMRTKFKERQTEVANRREKKQKNVPDPKPIAFTPMPKYQQLLHEFYRELHHYMRDVEAAHRWYHYKSWFKPRTRMVTLEDWITDNFENAKNLRDFKQQSDTNLISQQEPKPPCCEPKANITCRSFSYGMLLGILEGAGSGAIVVYANIHQPGGVIFVLFSTLLGVATPTVIYPTAVHNHIPERMANTLRGGLNYCWSCVPTISTAASQTSITMSPIHHGSSRSLEMV